MKQSGYVAPRILLPVAACIALAAVDLAHAQPQDTPTHGFVSIGGGGQLDGHQFSANTSLQKFGETAELAIDYMPGQGGFLDVAGGVRVWHALALGVGCSSTI